MRTMSKRYDYIRESGNYQVAIDTLLYALEWEFLDALQASTVLADMFSLPKEITLADILDKAS